MIHKDFASFSSNKNWDMLLVTIDTLPSNQHNHYNQYNQYKLAIKQSSKQATEASKHVINLSIKQASNQYNHYNLYYEP